MKSGLMEKSSRFRLDMLLESHDALYDDGGENINVIRNASEVFHGIQKRSRF